MFRRHPLENPSLAPFGLATPAFQKRLEYTPTNDLWIDAEKLLARLWDKRNRANVSRPLPVQTIIHEILPGLAQASRLTKGDFMFDSLPYLTRDIVILSSVVQWFGTNCGRCFLEEPIFGGVSHPEREFLDKLAKENEHRDMVAFWCHVCTPQCNTNRSLFLLDNRCFYPSSSVSARDRAVVEGLMRWLGRVAGREFVVHYLARKKRMWDSARNRHIESLQIKKAAA